MVARHTSDSVQPVSPVVANRLAIEGSFVVLLADALEPRLLPEDQAGRLTAAIGLAVAAKIEMHRVRQAQADILSAHRVAGLVRALVDLEALAAIAEHLRHEGQS